jgi:hypothetical protein
MVDPRQKVLFDPAESMFSPMAVAMLREGWPHVFRAALLELMPAAELGAHFHEYLGAPTKELYGMAGAIFLKEYFNLTIAEAVERCVLDGRWLYALNIQPLTASMSHASIERYARLIAQDELAGEIFARVTAAFIRGLEVDVSRQRLDSTHIYSDMAHFGRSRLMAVTIKRFLVQLQRHEAAGHEALAAALRERYAAAESQLFGCYQGDRRQLRQTLGEDLLHLVSRFADQPAVANRSSYQAMARVLAEQCDVVEETVQLRQHPGGHVLQNPSDPDASYAHKGPGYSAQIAQTCVEGNAAQLITAVQVDPAHVSDQTALGPMLGQLAAQQRQPEVMYADTNYGGDPNVQQAQQRGVDLQSPVVGQTPADGDQLTPDDFAIDERTELVECCPNGRKPLSSQFDPKLGRTRTVMAGADCQGCDFRSQCPVHRVGADYVLLHTPVQRRCAARRAEQNTDAFREHYAIRAGQESTNSALKRVTGLGRLRTRGLPRMRMGALLRCAGWNMKRATAALRAHARQTGRALADALANALANVPANGATALRPLGQRFLNSVSFFRRTLGSASTLLRFAAYRSHASIRPAA